MDLQKILGLWWTVPAGLAVVGYACSLAGLTRPQRAVWVTARVVEVHPPGHGESGNHGIPVTIAYQDPGTGREFRLRHENKRGDRVLVAWVGQEFPVRFPRRRPERFSLMLDSEGRTSGAGGPNCMVLLLVLGLVVQSFFVWGWQWGLICVGGLLLAVVALSRDGEYVRARAAQLAEGVTVQGRVIAVTSDVHSDGEGGESVSHASVVTFTTHEGVEVTALCTQGIPEVAKSLGRAIPLRYAPADPSLLTADPDHERRERLWNIRFIATLLIAGIVAIGVGGYCLHHPWPFT
ncbi:DUF3592 domain-containing protein [Streptomyces griseorubiginosus]|uniref:DUF3592 domain-containing protein n=1 Tax=Streptomyces griseorubiginosus TaxID=67304 RepID=UPI002E80AEF7|nr:DUF3592 domain-containing protein [Streptomyces griseorubiginosus]WUB42037.1 DUF3592 domain-containing protein [Streptomyces griseorubiginosus]WUB50556.1 DUF3592 domain-containing protein [Streptomyces griseorubiginosus]